MGALSYRMGRMLDVVSPRMLPSFIIIGAQKSGTTHLFNVLSKHPSILPPKRKELHFFDRNADHRLGFSYYRQLFPRKPWFGGRFVTFEATPSYMWEAHYAERIHQVMPQVLIVAVLRDPVKRAFSAWQMSQRKKDHPVQGHLYDPLSFEEAVRGELAGEPRTGGSSYLRHGEYAEQLRPFVDLFGKDRVKVFSFRDMRDRLPWLVGELCLWSGIEVLPADHSAFTLPPRKGGYDVGMAPGLEAELYRHFQPGLEALDHLMGRPMDLIEH
ncbi:MAG: sulfotransferase [Flavobacteriales bacterium]|nr:sulfotransferase [Flavobacteriales bacterium]